MTPPKITIVGSNMIDLITKINRLPRPGETIDAQNFEMGYGGKGANQAVVASLLGGDVTIVTRVGDDVFGKGVIKNLQNYNINTKYVEVAKGSSNGVAPIFVDKKGQNRILIFRGANTYLKPNDINNCQEVLIKSDIILLQLEIPLETVYHTIKICKKYNIPVILNPAPVIKLDFDIINSVDILIPNEVELETIIGKKLNNIEEIKIACKTLIDKGLKNVIVTLGEAGALLVNSNTSKLIPSINVKPVDTTGAGDAFIGSFATFYEKDKDILNSVKKANMYAAFSTLKDGTQNSYFNMKEFNRRINNL